MRPPHSGPCSPENSLVCKPQTPLGRCPQPVHSPSVELGCTHIRWQSVVSIGDLAITGWLHSPKLAYMGSFLKCVVFTPEEWQDPNRFTFKTVARENAVFKRGQGSPVPSILLWMPGFHYFLWLKNIPSCMYVTFSLSSISWWISMLSDVSQAQENKYYIFSLICGS